MLLLPWTLEEWSHYIFDLPFWVVNTVERYTVFLFVNSLHPNQDEISITSLMTQCCLQKRINLYETSKRFLTNSCNFIICKIYTWNINFRFNSNKGCNVDIDLESGYHERGLEEVINAAMSLLKDMFDGFKDSRKLSF